MNIHSAWFAKRVGSHGPWRLVGKPLSALAIYALCHAAYLALTFDTLSGFYHDALILVSADLIRWIAPGETLIADVNRLISARVQLEVVRGCDGAGVLFFLVSAMVVGSASWTGKLLGVLGAVGLIYSMNLVRLTGLYFVAAYRPDWFLPLHSLFVPVAMIGIACLFYAAWLEINSAVR